jgi:hypothetical protein
MFGARDLQEIINKGDLDQANTILDGIEATADATVDVAEAQADATVDVAEEQGATAEALAAIDAAMQTERVDSEELVLLQELKDALELGKLDAATAITIQRSIARGEFSKAQAQLSGIRAQADATVDVAEAQGDAAVDVAEEQGATAEALAAIDASMQSERVTSEEKVLLEELKTEVTLGRIDAASAKSIQNIIMKGDLAESRQQLEYAREIASGTVSIDGTQVDTIEKGRFNLEEQLTDAQLQQLVKTEQGQSIANLLALVQTLEPGSVARGELEAEIALQISNTVDDEALEKVLVEMLSPIETGGL